jgi:hypothetical protein
MASNPVEPQRATARLRIRQGAASTSASKDGYIEAGAIFEPIGTVVGQDVLGNATWFELTGRRFVWSGASRKVQAAAAPSAASGMKVKRRSDGTLQVLTPAERESVFGKFAFQPASQPGAIRIDAGWVRENIVELPTSVFSHLGRQKITVHRKAADPFARVFDKIEQAKLGDQIRTFGGTWVARHMGWDPRRSLSTHSWGAAIDLNVRWNGYGQVPAALGSMGSLRELVPIFESEGFAWGGYFRPRSITDGMHFELSRLEL